jgi:hypothetical protein
MKALVPTAALALFWYSLSSPRKGDSWSLYVTSGFVWMDLFSSLSVTSAVPSVRVPRSCSGMGFNC